VVDLESSRYAQHIGQWFNRLLMEREIRDINDTGITVTMALTTKQESFCQLVSIQQKTLTDAYIEVYDTGNMKQDSIYQLSCRLSKQVKIRSRIDALQATITQKLASEVVWNKAKIVSELSINVDLGRETKQLAASNQAINLIGKAINVFGPDIVAVSGTVSVIHSLSDAQLDQLAALASEPLAIDDSEAIEAESYQLLDTETE
jgi:hypothetical protein